MIHTVTVWSYEEQKISVDIRADIWFKGKTVIQWRLAHTQTIIHHIINGPH